MTDKLELDPRILVKNLEITKLTQQVDSLKSKVIDLKQQLKEIKRVTHEPTQFPSNMKDVT